MAAAATENQNIQQKPERTSSTVWKFGYGSNMSVEFMRSKKGLNPLDSKRTKLLGFCLSFPEGRGIDFVEPAFATLKSNPNPDLEDKDEVYCVHGVSTLLTIDEANKLDEQERGYHIALCKALIYDDNNEGNNDIDDKNEPKTILVEVYVPRKPLSLEHPEGCCSDRYRDILIKGALENNLDNKWIEKLKKLKIYQPSIEILNIRKKQLSPSELPVMTIEELSKFDGEHVSDENQNDEQESKLTKQEGGEEDNRSDNKKFLPVRVSSCGYIFECNPMFKVMRGRDVTNRNVMHRQGLNLEIKDDGGKSPFPNLSKLSPEELEYALRYRDRFISQSGGAIAVLKEFWEEQETSLENVFYNNTLSKL